ncbi:MAG: SDR family NAD(P)-dependent oxidoreductase [Planctomycetota bacterium]|nr:MAG: SDR family NAD(P)-dependent oxidoreductase [Planctomycetota bacterium]
MNPARPLSVVISGAGSGIGRACAELLRDRGWRVWAGYRRAEDGRALAAAGFRPLRLEVRDERSVAEAAATVAACCGADGLQGLVNNAGIAVAGPLEFLPLASFELQLDVNLTGVLRCGRAFLPLLRRGRGRMVNIGSMAGLIAGPMLGPYHASKWALEGLSDTWRRELLPQGVAVALIEPGAVATPIWRRSAAAAEELAAGLPEEAGRLYGRLHEGARRAAVRAEARAVPPARVAAAVRHALEARRPRTRYRVGRDARLAAVLRWLPDRWLDRLILRP